MKEQECARVGRARPLGVVRTTTTFALVGLVLSAACERQPTEPGDAVVLLAAGDIASCSSRGDEATAALLDSLDGTIAALGDNVFTPDGYTDCYQPTWGRHKERTSPAPGNHEYDTGTADPYFDYFGDAAGPRGKGYYSYDLGTWHIIVLNTEVDYEAGGEQMQWLMDDLARNTSECVLAFFHRPRHYQGSFGKSIRAKKFWELLYAAGADVVVNGHHHLYERYARLDPNGHLDPLRGIRQFIAGTGGHGHDPLVKPHRHVEVRNNTTFGVLKLSLRSGGYAWEFVPEPGSTFTDVGSDNCR